MNIYVGSGVTIFAYFKFKTLLYLPKSALAGIESDTGQKANNKIWYSWFEKAT